jgi:inorganic pyrophosphatase
VYNLKMNTFEIAKEYLGKEVEVTIDRPLNSAHPKHGYIYEVNYGFIAGVTATDGEDLDAYVLGIKKPLNKFIGQVIAIAHRENDDDDKLIVVPKDFEISDEEIMKQVNFQEQWFKTKIFR